MNSFSDHLMFAALHLHVLWSNFSQLPNFAIVFDRLHFPVAYFLVWLARMVDSYTWPTPSKGMGKTHWLAIKFGQLSEDLVFCPSVLGYNHALLIRMLHTHTHHHELYYFVRKWPDWQRKSRNFMRNYLCSVLIWLGTAALFIRVRHILDSLLQARHSPWRNSTWLAQARCRNNGFPERIAAVLRMHQQQRRWM